MVWGGVKELGLRAADVVNYTVGTVTTYADYAVGDDPVTGWEFYRGSASNLGQILDSGQTTALRATLAAVPGASSFSAAALGQDLLTGDAVTGVDRVAAGFSLLGEVALAGAGGAAKAGFNPAIGAGNARHVSRSALSRGRALEGVAAPLTRFDELSKGVQRLVTRLTRSGQSSVGRGLAVQDLADASRFLGREIAVAQRGAKLRATATFISHGMIERDQNGWGSWSNTAMSAWEGAGFLVG